jgi:hypothetical protein
MLLERVIARTPRHSAPLPREFLANSSNIGLFTQCVIEGYAICFGLPRQGLFRSTNQPRVVKKLMQLLDSGI